jgi:SnoaL-like domain
VNRSSREEDPTESLSPLRELIDRNEITELVSRLGAWLDEKRWGEARWILTEDVTAKTPGGAVTGIDHVVAQARRNHSVPTQHVITNLLIELAGDRAEIRANLIATFADRDGSVPRHQRGERYRLEAVRIQQAWRLSRVESRPIWDVGSSQVL